MDAAELQTLWERNKDRPAFVREHREVLAEHLTDGVVEDLPSPGTDSLFEWRQFLNDYKGTVTRQLNDAVADEPEADA